MFPFILRALRAYAPYITLPVAAVVGVIGYKVENMLSDKYTPYRESIQNQRSERQLKSEDLTQIDSLKEKRFVPNTIFEKNVSPSLKD
ncbi:small integral membrane protein 12-A [Lycorma delicatula]|uniref:small integral membrane protein 12-A n=1 Tax=Lycorma delicatula TaxID=130591 RepID=UPI003F519803